MTMITPQHTADNTVKNIYFSPDKVNFSALIQAAQYDTPTSPSATAETCPILGHAPFISRSAFDRSYHRFSAFLAAPPHKPSFADPAAEEIPLIATDVTKINLDAIT